MRVCLVLDSQPGDTPVGGVEKATHSLCGGLRRAGHDVMLIGSGRGSGEAWQDFPVVRVPASGRHMLVGGAREWSAAVLRALAGLDPDIAQGQGLGFAGSAVTRWRGCATVVCAHGNTLMDLRHAHAQLGWALRAPLVRAHAVRALRRADAVVNVTSDWRVNCPVKPRDQFHIPNPVDDAFFAAVASPERASVAYFGGERRIKGADLLLVAWHHVLRAVPDARLHLYGFDTDGAPYLPPNCIPHAALTSSEATALAMGRAAAVVLPSRYEVTPVVAAEAMAVGVPLIATDVGGVRAMTDGVAGICRIDPLDIASEIVSALRGPQAWANRIAEGKRRSATYRVECVVERYVELYESLNRDA